MPAPSDLRPRLVRCSCDRCSAHVAALVDDVGPLGCCPLCGGAYLTPVRDRLGQIVDVVVSGEAADIVLPRANCGAWTAISRSPGEAAGAAAWP